MCNKTFLQYIGLKMHLRAYTGGKLFNCNHCDKAFSHNNNFVKYLRIYADEKPYQYSHYGWAFSKMCVLIDHIECTLGINHVYAASVKRISHTIVLLTH